MRLMSIFALLVAVLCPCSLSAGGKERALASVQQDGDGHYRRYRFVSHPLAGWWRAFPLEGGGGYSSFCGRYRWNHSAGIGRSSPVAPNYAKQQYVLRT